MTQSMNLMHKAFAKNKDTTRTCAQTLQPVGQFAPNAMTPVTISMGANEVYTQGSKVSGQAEFEISRMYLSDNFPLVQRPNSYVSTLYMEALVGPTKQMMKSRAVATVVVTIDAAGKIKECNVSTQQPSNRETCDAMYGMTWDEGAQECQQALSLDANFNMSTCPAGTHKVGQTCIPTASGCANGQLARGFDLGIVQTCEEPPLNPAVGEPTQSVAGPVEGQPNQTPAPLASPGQRLPAVSTSGVTPAVSASATPSSCIDLIGTTNYNYCYANLTCRAYLASNPPAGPECVAQTSIAYATPAPARTPSPAPPPDLTCACNDARIANGEYCMYCIPQVDYGYGYVDYAYGVSKCSNGNLVPDQTASAAAEFPPPECSGGYAPVRRTLYNGTYRYRQMNGYNLYNIQ